MKRLLLVITLLTACTPEHDLDYAPHHSTDAVDRGETAFAYCLDVCGGIEYARAMTVSSDDVVTCTCTMGDNQ